MPQSENISPTNYSNLSPDLILDAIESCGYEANGSMLALNSYENRVYRIEVNHGQAIVAKFYRPLRWTDDAILEEHQFSLTLLENELPIVAPLVNKDNQSLFHYQGYRFALFPMQGGRWPEFQNVGDYEWMGRFLGRIHHIGANCQFKHRHQISLETYGEQSAHYLLSKQFIPMHIETAYETVTDDLFKLIKACYDLAGNTPIIRLHGDCHRGNILWREQGPHFVDLDDACNGPAIQDLWMLLSGDQSESSVQLSHLLKGYQAFADFDYRQLNLIEALRTLRMMNYAAWLAKRWQDPSFKIAFPWFDSTNYWEQHLQELREQLYLIQEPVMKLSE
ncbi:MAG: serine/threonine protein kinase [Gammaproteobacteria bacterium]|nr:serine/threonine protein kinase [Gammaproteobacteria bacterium]